MPRPAPRGRPRPLRAPLQFQVLRVSFQIFAEDPAVERDLHFLAQSASQPEPAESSLSYEVRRSGDGYEILREGVVEDVQFDPKCVLGALYQRLQRDALAAWPGAAVLQAVTGRRHGNRFVVVGETLSDRSRLALELIRLGVDVEGDDLAILHDGVITPYPRPMRVCGADAPLPSLAPAVSDLPCAGTDLSLGPWALDLALAGIDWRITSGPLDVAIALETNYGGQSRSSEMPPVEMARILMSGCDPLMGASHAVGAVARLAGGARCHRLRLGSLGDVDAFCLPLLL